MKTVLLYHPNRHHVEGYDQAVSHYEKHVPCKFDVCDSWEDFLSKLSPNYDLVAILSDFLNRNDNVEIVSVVKTIQTLLTLKKSTAKIAFSIDKSCTKETIMQLKQAGCVGVIPSRPYWGIDAATEGWKGCLSGEYWPDDIIETLPDKRQITITYFLNRENQTVESYEVSDKLRKNGKQVFRYNSLCELSHALSAEPDYLGFHTDMLNNEETRIGETMLMVKALLSHLKIKKQPKLFVVFDNDTHVSVIKEIQKSNVQFFIPSANSYGAEFSYKLWNQVTDGGLNNYYPKNIISELPGNKVLRNTGSRVTLTSRQKEVFHLIARRGLSNKQIAKVMNISESTVKIHVSSIFRTLCVRNRTQLALTKI